MKPQKPEKEKDQMRTPPHFFKAIEEEFDCFELDACAGPENALCNRYLTREVNALEADLSAFQLVWWNPPYSAPKKFVLKAYESSLENGSTHVMLLPGSTSTAWWEIVRKAAEIRFVEHRLAFLDHDGNPQQSGSRSDSVLVIFRPMSLWERIKRWLCGPQHTYAEYRDRPTPLEKDKSKEDA